MNLIVRHLRGSRSEPDWPTASTSAGGTTNGPQFYQSDYHTMGARYDVPKVLGEKAE